MSGYKFHVYTYQHIDYQDFTIHPCEAWYKKWTDDNFEDVMAAVRQEFEMAGWEGDGEIRLIWLPSFLFLNSADELLIWHVKQSNNGTSFLASKIELPFPSLLKMASPA
jgi:hypothetical protein